MDRVKAVWASVRPRTRRGGILAVVAIIGSAAALSVALFVGGAMAWTPYVTFDLDQGTNARAWAAFEPSFAGSASCAACHAPAAIAVKAAPHVGVACESCHSALAGHVAEARQSPKIALAPLKAPTNEACIHCHVDTTGRPAGFPTIDIYQHFKPVCLDCHDPHTAQAKRPPEVLHPRADLPACITCHGPDGFKARNQRHPVEATNDAACLECHAKGRGPQRVENR